MTEAARPAAARGHEDIVADHALGAPLSHCVAQEVDQVAGGESRGTARAGIDVVFARQQIAVQDFR